MKCLSPELEFFPLCFLLDYDVNKRFLIYLYIVFKSSCFFCRNLAHLAEAHHTGVLGYGKKNSLIWKQYTNKSETAPWHRLKDTAAIQLYSHTHPPSINKTCSIHNSRLKPPSWMLWSCLGLVGYAEAEQPVSIKYMSFIWSFLLVKHLKQKPGVRRFKLTVFGCFFNFGHFNVLEFC